MKLASKIFTLTLAMAMAGSACAQKWYKVNVHESNYGFEWSFPYETEHFSHFDFSADGNELRAHRIDEVEGVVNYVPFMTDNVDSVVFADELAEELQTHNKYQVYSMNITTDGSVGVLSKDEYVNCYISLDGRDGYNMYSGTGRIRGRGNSTWKWYDKKPYRIKLDTKHKMLGLDSNKDWVLLANFRDVTDLMNTFMFEVARWMGMPYCNHTRYVELFLDGEYRGLYQLTEQVEQGNSRVAVADNGGILLGMDVDDGPELCPDATDNFWSKVYSMPMVVKYPKDVDAQTKDSIRGLLAELENVIKSADYDALDSIMDMRSFMTMAMLQEYSYNVELAAPRSIFMYKDVNGKWAMGPFWDWDAGFDFDWSDMYTGHVFFNNYRNLLLGTDPANRIGARGGVPRYFTDMFKSDRYTREYKALWNSVKDSIFTRNWAEMERYISELNKGAYARDLQRWPLTYTTGGGWWGGQTVSYVIADEIEKMRKWLVGRTAYLDNIINAYPVSGNEGDDQEPEYGVLNTYTNGTNIDIYVKMKKTAGYTQSDQIEIDPSMLAQALGLSESEINSATVSLTSLNSNGSVGRNTGEGTWGAWFNDNGDVVSWNSESHVYINPSNTATSDVYSWSYGCHPNICSSGDQHTVKMRYSVTRSRQTLYVYVTVHFGIDVLPTGTYDNINVDPSLFSWRNMQSVGEETITRSYDLATVAAYAKQPISINLDGITAQFPDGATINDLTYMVCKDVKTGELISRSTAYNNETSSNGFYMLFDGTAAAWGSSDCKVGYNPSSSTIDFAYTADTSRPQNGTTCSASVFLVYENKYYYRLRMNITLV